MIQRILTLVIQILLGWAALTIVFSIGGNFAVEIIANLLIFTAVTCAAGWAVGRLMNNPLNLSKTLMIGTAVGTLLGIVSMNMPWVYQLRSVVYPLIGSLAGYHLAVGRG